MLASGYLMAENNAMANEHIKFYNWPEELAAAAEYVLTTKDDIDFAVVPGFADRTTGFMFESVDQARKAIPEIKLVEDVIRDWYSHNPVAGFRLAPGVMHTGFGVF